MPSSRKFNLAEQPIENPGPEGTEMRSHLRRVCDGRRLAWCFLAAMLALRAIPANAVPINHGDFGPDPPGVTMYLGVTESSSTDPIPPARFGAPTLSGNVLDFNPTEFAAMATAGGLDITDVQLNFTVMTSSALAGLTSLAFSESGDYTLFGAGTAATQVAAGLAVKVDIFEVDGVPLAVPLSQFLNASVSFNLVNNGPTLVAPWSMGLSLDLAAILNNAGVSFTAGVTKATVVLNDQLLALSEPASIAFIAKKDFKIVPGTQIVPEPSSLALVMAGIAGCAWASRRRLVRALYKPHDRRV